MPITTLDVFACTLDEIFQTEYHYEHAPFQVPCYFGMSINDDILHYDITEQIVRRYFQRIAVKRKGRMD